MKNPFYLVTLFFLMFSPELYADLAAKKAARLERIEQHIADLQKESSCVKNASSKEAIKICKNEKKTSRKAWKEKRKAERSTKIDQKIKKLEERKAKLAK